MMVPEGRKRSFNVTLDNVQGDQDVYGYNSLNLLNSHTDPTFLRSVLYLQAARDYLPAAKANWVRVVINGESWGVYVNIQQVDKPFLAEWFKTKNGTRWKVPGSPNGRGGLEYLGADVSAYKQIYEIKGDDDPKAWAALVELTRVLNQTPPESLEQALAPIMDVDNVLRFLAVEAALVNNDGYWVRASDYNIYLDTKGRFHLIPHDTNETFPVARGRRRTRVRTRRRRDARSARRSRRHRQAASLEAPGRSGAPHALPRLRAGDLGQVARLECAAADRHPFRSRSSRPR